MRFEKIHFLGILNLLDFSDFYWWGLLKKREFWVKLKILNFEKKLKMWHVVPRLILGSLKNCFLNPSNWTELENCICFSTVEKSAPTDIALTWKRCRTDHREKSQIFQLCITGSCWPAQVSQVLLSRCCLTIIKARAWNYCSKYRLKRKSVVAGFSLKNRHCVIISVKPHNYKSHTRLKHIESLSPVFTETLFTVTFWEKYEKRAKIPRIIP